MILIRRYRESHISGEGLAEPIGSLISHPWLMKSCRNGYDFCLMVRMIWEILIDTSFNNKYDATEMWLFWMTATNELAKQSILTCSASGFSSHCNSKMAWTAARSSEELAAFSFLISAEGLYTQMSESKTQRGSLLTMSDCACFI